VALDDQEETQSVDVTDPEVSDQVETEEADLSEEDAAAEDAAADGEMVITMEGEEPPEEEPDLDERGKAIFRTLRQKLSDANRKLREVETKAPVAQAEDEDPGPEPMLEDPDIAYDQKALNRRLLEWHGKKQAIEARKQERQAKNEQALKDHNARFDGYTEAKKALVVPDFDAAEETIRTTLSPAAQSIILRVLPPDQAAKAVYALGRSKNALAELAKIDAAMDPDIYTAALLDKVKGIKVTTKTPPPPDSKVKSGSAAGLAPATNASLEAELKRARADGNYDRVMDIKRRMKAG
jgi:hypothetical protein